MRGLLAAALLLAVSCASAPRERTFVGTYLDSFEMMAFQECGRSERWWVRAEPDALRALQTAAPPRANPNDGFWVSAEVAGELSEQGRYGHLSQYPRELHITRVIDARVGPPSCS